MKNEQRVSKALRNSSSKCSSAKWTLRHDLKPGDIGYLTQLHGILYAREHEYDQTFEAYVASGLAEFVQTFQPDKDRIWLAEMNDQTIGSIAIVGRSRTEAQVRWLLVHPDCRGLGLGKELLKEAILFCKECKYRNVFLWTTSELIVARHLYSSAGFSKTEERSHQLWGKMVTEEKYDLHL
jgi:N-acetylglutamate synthase-like GNAT family acetyltransferase